MPDPAVSEGPYPLLLSPWRLGSLQLRNRTLCSPMTTGFGFVDGAPDEQLLAYFRARSRGVGMAVVAFGAVSPEGRVERMIPEMWRADAGDRLVPLVEAIHDVGAAACLQLGHGGRQVSPRVTGREPVAPSPVPPMVHVETPPHGLSLAEVEQVVGAFGHAAGQAAAAGFDAIELHGGHGYLVQQFLAAASNRRADRYGGADVAARARFGTEVVQAIRAAAPDLTLLVRINGDDLVPGGQTRDDAVAAARAFVDAGAQAIVVSAGVYGSVPYTIPLLDDDEVTFLDPCRHVRGAVAVPVVAVGRISTPATAEAILARGDADAVALGRALLTDPDWVAKATAGRPGDIRPCIATVQGCAGMLQHGEPISCSVNPDVGREHLPPLPAALPSGSGGRITVVGGGVAGLEAARRAAELGHAVTLFERTGRLGGATLLAATVPALAHFAKLVTWFERMLDAAGVDVRLDAVPDAAELEATEPELVVIATGAREAPPVLDGYEHLPAWLASELLAGASSSLDTGLPGTLAVLGAGQRALATAGWAAARGVETTVLADGRVGSDTSGLARRAMIDRLRRTGVAILAGRASELTPDGVRYTAVPGRSETLADAHGGLLRCEGVVVAEPLRPVPAGARAPAGVEAVHVGDARDPADIASAIADARDTIDAHVRERLPV